MLRFNGETGAYIADFVPSGYGGLDGPGSILFRPDGVVLVSSYWNDSIKQYSWPTGEFLGNLNLYGVPLSKPGPVVRASDGAYLIGSTGNNSVIEWTETDARVLIASGSGGLNRPTGICETPAGDLLVVGRNSRNVLRFDRVTGAFRGVFVATGYGGLVGELDDVILLPRPCRGDFNRDGTLNTLDVMMFLNAWTAGCP